MKHRINYKLNINTLNGYTFQIEMTTMSKRQEQYDKYNNTFDNIRRKIEEHYKNKVLDKFISDNNIDITKQKWNWWLWNDDIVNEMRKYMEKCQILIYNGEILTHEMILNDKVILKDNDNIDVIFMPNPRLENLNNQ